MDKIEIEYEETSMNFLDMIIEYGVLELLHFNVVTDGSMEKLKFGTTVTDDKQVGKLKKGKSLFGKLRKGNS